MPTDRRRRAVAVVAAALLVSMAVGPAVVAGRPAYEIPVREADDGARFADPGADAWLNTSSVEVPLASAPSGAPNASDVTAERASVRVVRTERDLYVRLEWADPTANRSEAGPRQFPDKAAIELPVNASARPPISMGSTGTPVNVWVWRATGDTEELLAGGPGTTTRFANATVEANATHEDGHWAVVFHRELHASSPNRTDIALENDLNVAFAAWDGANMERGGHKAVSEWYYLPFAPDDGGPPYEAILWGIAGLAVVLVVAMTVEGVRRTGHDEEDR